MDIGLVRRGWSSTGGAERYLGRLAEGLAQNGHSLTLYASEWPKDRFPWGEVVRVPGASPLQFANHFSQLRRSSHDAVFSMERVPGCDLFRAGDGVHAAWLERRREFDPPWKTWSFRFNPKHRQLLALEKAVFDPRTTGMVIANSKLVAGEATAVYGFPTEKIRVIPNGFTPPPVGGESRREVLRGEWGVARDETAVLFLGSGWERKGLRFAVEAIGQSKASDKLRLIVAGRGPEKKFRGSRVLHLGPVAEPWRIFSAADLFLLPTWYDPFSNASLEALAGGLPVVTTRDNGMSEILEPNRTGSILSRPDAIDEIRSALALWKERLSTETRARCSSAASQYSLERNVSETLQAFRNVVGGAPKSANPEDAAGPEGFGVED